MKIWSLKFRSVDRDGWEAIRDGAKTIETRAATEKYSQIKAGDVLVTACGKDKIEKAVKKVEYYGSIEELFQNVPLKSVMPFAETIEDAKKGYYSYPGYREKIAKHGILAFYL